MKNLIIFTIFLAFAISCSQKINPSGAPSEIYGNWQWVSSSGGYAPKTITPATEGYQKSISFTSTGNYSEQQSNGQSKNATFTITRGKSIYNKDSARIILFDGLGDRHQKQSFEVRGDTLLLRDECFDCFSHTYIKKR